MNKKLVGLMLASSMLLVACGSGDDAEDGSSMEEETEQVEDVTEKKEGHNLGDVIKAEGGYSEVIGVWGGEEESQDVGDFTVTIEDVRLLDYQPEGDLAEYLGDDRIGMVSIGIKVEHKNEETETIHPAQSVMVSDNGIQLNSELLLSDNVGGDFYGEVVKDGTVLFLTESDDDYKNIESIRYIIEAPNKDLETIGEDLEFSIELDK